MTDRGQAAKELFCEGHTCCQSVLLAFADRLPVTPSVARRLAGPFGGGLGGLRLTCGAVTGMIMVLGLLYGFDDPGDRPAKAALYADVRALADAFAARHGSLQCRELLAGLPEKLKADPSLRTDRYYQIRPCALFVEEAARLLQAYIDGHPLPEA